MLFFVAVARATSISVNLLWENSGISSLTVKSAVNIKGLLSFVFRSDWYEEVQVSQFLCLVDVFENCTHILANLPKSMPAM